MIQERNYTISREDGRLIFRTSSFRVERESVLHKGIYSYELSSMMAAIAVSGVLYAIFAFSYRMTFVHYLLIVVVFVTAFVIFRMFIFKERFLEVVFDRPGGSVRLSWPGIFRKKTEEIPMDSIKSIEIGSAKITPENPDGIEFVERISMQHGGVIPGLGDEAEFITLLLRLTDGSERLIHAARIEGRIEGEPELPLKELRDFLNPKGGSACQREGI